MATTNSKNDEKVLINVRVKRTLQDEMREAADRLEIPVSQFVRMAVKRQLDELNIRRGEEIQ